MAVDDTIEREKRRGEKGTRERKGAGGKNLENAFFFFSQPRRSHLGNLRKTILCCRRRPITITVYRNDFKKKGMSTGSYALEWGKVKVRLKKEEKAGLMI